MEIHFLQVSRYKMLDAMGKGIILPELLVLAERERERERERGLHLGVISLNYINTVLTVADRQTEKRSVGKENTAISSSLKIFERKPQLLPFKIQNLNNNFVKQNGD